MFERTFIAPHQWRHGLDGDFYLCKRCAVSKVEDRECVTDEFKVAFLALYAALVRYDARKGWTPSWARGLRFQCARWVNRWQGLKGFYFAERTPIPLAKRCVLRGLEYGAPRYLKRAAEALDLLLA